ncbi:hypothetical protein BU17DRAFT_68985 [Hysterangium stoloniferum]|nr:hypothetical protein BU17DRAFT_68985 [Hysterangium stoloniferum]
MQMIQGLMDTLKREITELGAFAVSPSSLPDMFHDDTANISPGYSCIMEENNNFTITWEMLMDRILKCDNLQVRKIFGEVVDGQTILAFDHMIMTAIQADKTAGISGWGKVKPHWMPLELVPMFVWYLLVLQPLQIMVAEQLLGEDIASLYHCYLWMGPMGKWLTDYFTLLIQQYTLEAMGTENAMILSSSQQVLCGLFFHHCNAQFWKSDVKSDDELMIERIGDMQAGHTSAIVRNHYAMELPHFQELKERVFRAVFVYTLMVHLFWGLSVPKIDGDGMLSLADDTGEILCSAISDGLDNMKSKFSNKLKAVETRLMMVMWVTVCKVISAIVEGLRRDAVFMVPSHDHLDCEMQTHLDLYLQGKWSQFRHYFGCYQQRHSGLETLLADCEWRCQEAGVSYGVWSKDDLRPFTSVVFVSAEEVITGKFLGYAKHMCALGR